MFICVCCMYIAGTVRSVLIKGGDLISGICNWESIYCPD